MFSDFIKHYNNIRGILRNVFLYGCFSRGGLENKNVVSSRKVSYEIRRIQQYIESEFIKVDKDGRNKLLSLTYDPITNTKNFLVNTYLSKSFTKTDITLYFYLLMSLNYISKPSTFSEIEEFLIEHGLISYDNISSKTIERKIKELCKMDILSVVKKGRCKAYKISEDILRNFNKEELYKLFIVENLYKNILCPTISGYYCEGTLKDYMNYERNMDKIYDDCFQYKNLHFHPIIEEELVWKCIKAIKNKNLIATEFDKKVYRHKGRPTELLKPIKLRYDANCGRYYLISFNEQDKCIASRLDRLEDIKVYNVKYDDDTLEEKYKAAMEKSWSSVPKCGKDSIQYLELKVIIKDPREMYILNKIKLELQCFKHIEESEGVYILKKEVVDVTEMIPWLRSYGTYIKVISPRRLARRLERDWKETLRNYGVI